MTLKNGYLKRERQFTKILSKRADINNSCKFTPIFNQYTRQNLPYLLLTFFALLTFHILNNIFTSRIFFLFLHFSLPLSLSHLILLPHVMCVLLYFPLYIVSFIPSKPILSKMSARIRVANDNTIIHFRGKQ
jgi:uncharacterized integral membrane protein